MLQKILWLPACPKGRGPLVCRPHLISPTELANDNRGWEGAFPRYAPATIKTP